MLTSSFRSVGFNFVLSIRRYRSAKERQSDFDWISFCDSLFLSPWRGRRTTHKVRWHKTASIENKEKQLFSYWLDFICIKFLADTCLSCQFDNIGSTPWIYPVFPLTRVIVLSHIFGRYLLLPVLNLQSKQKRRIQNIRRIWAFLYHQQLRTFLIKKIQSFLRSVNAKLTGTKHELAQRAYEKLSQVRREGVLVENDGNVSNAENATISSSDVNTPSFEELTAGWTSNLNNTQKIMHTDVENYFINSRHRTVDRKKCLVIDSL